MPTVIVACAPSERRELEALTAAVFLCRAGYCVLYLGADTPLPDLKETAEALRPVGVLVSGHHRVGLAAAAREPLRAARRGAGCSRSRGAPLTNIPSSRVLWAASIYRATLLHAVAHFHDLVGASAPIGRASA